MSILAALAAITGCATTSGDRPAQVDDLVGRIERLHVEVELARERMGAAVSTLDRLLAHSVGEDPVATFARFEEAIQSSKQQLEILEQSTAAVTRGGPPVFDQWANDLAQMQSQSLRTASQQRLANTRQRFDTICTTAKAAIARYTEANKTLRDYALFLGNDYNPESIQALRGEVRPFLSAVGRLESDLDRCLHATREYVQATGLPADQSESASPDTPAAPMTESGR